MSASSKQALKEQFQSAYAKLNPEQKQAVDTIEGPVMVVAGPGTGKTQTVALRVANILERTHMRPSNILCLTFSVSGVKAMRERLRTFIGPDAYAVTIQTIHGFCNEIIQEHPEVFAEFNVLEQVTTLEQLRIVRSAIESLPVGSQLRKPRLGQDRASAVLSRISQLKRENIRPEDLPNVQAQYNEQILYTKTGKERGPSAALDADKKRVEQFGEFIQVYKGYQEALQKQQRYDYNDMILRCIDALQTYDFLLAPLQERYQYILVDEFQDLNQAQFKVLELLTNYVHTEQLPNICCVGDDDQAIYRFQGASVTNMQAFIAKYPQAVLIGLQQNYRSTQAIIDAASSVIDYNESRLTKTTDVQKQAVAASGTQGVMPTVLHVPNQELQAAVIAERLSEAHTDGTPWNEMAVICRTNAEVLELSELLESANIPCDVLAKRDLLQEPVIKELTLLLQAIVHPHDSALLSSALMTSLFDLRPLDHAQTWLRWREAQRATDQTEPLTLFAFCTNSQSPLQPAVEQIWQWHAKLATITVPALLEEILTTSGAIHAHGTEPQNPYTFALYTAFFDFIRNQCALKPQVTLVDLLQDIAEYEHEPTLALEFAIPHLVTDGVQIMTAHSSKGLEFEYVVVPNMWSGNWGKRRSQTQLALPDALIFGSEPGKEKELQQEDERRLCFVALTRAKNQVLLTMPEVYRSNDQLKPAETSVFIAEAGQTMAERTPDPASLPNPVSALLAPALNIDDAFTAFLQEQVKHFELSVTALNSFLNDPEVFLWEQLLKKPQAKRANLAFGTAVHSALEYFARTLLAGHMPVQSEVLEVFTNRLQHKEILTTTEQQEYLHLGQQILPQYLTAIQSEQSYILFTERQLKTVVEDIPLKGKIDRIDALAPNSQQVRIVDYKTGTVYKTPDAVRKKEDLYRQIVFYKLLADNTAGLLHEATEFRLDFIGNGTDERRAIDLQVTEQEVQELLMLIKKVWAKIQALDFTPLD